MRGTPRRSGSRARTRSWARTRWLPHVVVAIAALVLAACVEPLLAPDADDDPVALFDLVWSEVEGYYSYFAYKPEVDWHAIRDAYRPRVQPGMGDRALAELIGGMLAELRDGHLDLTTPFGRFGWNYRQGHPGNYDPEVVPRYLSDRRLFAEGVYEAGRVRPEIGYVRISTMYRDGTAPVLDDVLEFLTGIRALVVDVRDNGGGSDIQSEAMAARFFDRRRPYRVIQYRNGPGYDDFTDPVTDYIDPAGRARFTGPIALLTNRGTYSSAEGFVAAMQTLPHVITLGDSTGGGAGNPIVRELPNGWTYRIPRWVVFTMDGFQYEGIGLPPDIDLGGIDEQLVRGIDVFLIRAIDELEARLDAGSG